MNKREKSTTKCFYSTSKGVKKLLGHPVYVINRVVVPMCILQRALSNSGLSTCLQNRHNVPAVVFPCATQHYVYAYNNICICICMSVCTGFLKLTVTCISLRMIYHRECGLVSRVDIHMSLLVRRRAVAFDFSAYTSIALAGSTSQVL